jgi:hypothetical protein
MKVMTPGKLHFDHIMWEPDGRCEGKCAGCYQAQSPSRSYNGPLNSQILKYIFEDKSVFCDQLTISLNRVEPSEKLVNTLANLWIDIYRGKENPLLPRLCLTIRNSQEFLQWRERLGLNLYQLANPLSIISFSEGCSPEGIHTNLNRNFLVEDNFSWKECSISATETTYLMLKKPVLGKKVNLEDLENWFQTYLSFMPFSETIIPDTCIVESIRCLKTGYICSAGLEKAHVWADGVVTACPYDSLRQTSNNGRSLFAQLDTMNAGNFVYNQYPIEYCGIPVAIRELQKKNPGLVNSVIRKLGL